jgi:FAD/FMN-containing dehydrogenase
LIPSCIIIPETAQNISKILTVVDFFKTKFTVRGGGHSPNPGFSTFSEPGVLIDMQDLDQITINGDSSVATVGPGVEWIDVCEALDQYGASVIGAVVPQSELVGLCLEVCILISPEHINNN